MRSILFTLLCASATVDLANAAYLRPRSWREGSKAVGVADHVRGDESAFSRMLGSVSSQNVHQLIRDLAPGAPRNAIDAPAGHLDLPTAVVQLAVRQGTSGNETTTSDPPTSTGDSSSDTSSPTPPPDSSTDITTTPPTETSTNEPTETSPPTDSPTQTPTDTPPTVTPTDTSTPTQTPTQTPTETQPTPTSTSAPSQTPTSDSNEPTSSSPSPTTAPSSGSSPTPSKPSPTTTPTPTSWTSTYASTLPGGAVTMVTEVVVVTPGVTGEPSPAPTSEGELHHGNAAPNVRGSAFGILAALLFGGMLLA